MKIFNNILRKYSVLNYNKRYFCDKNVLNRPLILGIETSCDDTGAAVVDRNGNVLGEYISSQQDTHLKYGGIIPPIAQELHRQNIARVVDETMAQAKLDFNELDAIAVTNRPGKFITNCNFCCFKRFT